MISLVLSEGWLRNLHICSIILLDFVLMLDWVFIKSVHNIYKSIINRPSPCTVQFLLYKEWTEISSNRREFMNKLQEFWYCVASQEDLPLYKGTKSIRIAASS